MKINFFIFFIHIKNLLFIFHIHKNKIKNYKNEKLRMINKLNNK
jgi:hypothetical protein